MRVHATILASFILAGCTPPPAPAPPTPTPPPTQSAASSASSAPSAAHTLSGTVRGPDGAPARGALVAVIPHFELEYLGDPPEVPTTLTDAAGHYHFATIAPGRYGVTATLPGATAVYGGVHEITPETRLNVDMALGGESFTVTGTVRDAGGAPVPGARLLAPRLSENEGDVFVAFADPAGRYTLTLPAHFDHFLVVDAPPRPRAYQRIPARAQAVDFRLDPPPAPRPPDGELRASLARGAIPLSTLAPGSGTADLAPLKATIGDARVLAVGEATHGSAEFFHVRHRLLELLAGEMGFTVLAVEAGWADAFAVDDYVFRGVGDPEKALAGLRYWALDTTEMLAVVRWMRRYNQDPSHRRKLRFRGVDCEFTPGSISAVIAYLRKVDPPSVGPAEALFAPISGVMASSTYPGVDRAVIERTTRGVADLLARFDAERAAWIARAGEPAWTLARQHMNLLRQAEVSYRNPGDRDVAMADNVQWILDHEPPGARAVIWAHNAHIAAQQLGFSAMGRLLRERLGANYFAVGFSFGAGSFRALDWSSGRREGPVQSITLGPPPPASLDAALGLAGLPAFVLDLRAVTGPLGAWLDARTATRSVGGIFGGAATSGQMRSPKRSFDAIVYLDRITASHPNGPVR